MGLAKDFRMKEVKVGQLWETPFNGICIVDSVSTFTVLFYPLDNPDKMYSHNIHLFVSQNTLVDG